MFAAEVVGEVGCGESECGVCEFHFFANDVMLDAVEFGKVMQ